MRLVALAPVFASLGLLLAGCTYQGAIDTPVTQKATWFSYLNADDIRASCRPGAPTQLRFVYNGTYNDQVRSYELVADGSGGATQTSRVQGRPNLTSIAISGFSDLMAPWRWTRSTANLTSAEADALGSALRQSGFFVPLEDRLVLHSIGYWWIVAGCNDGEFVFHAWDHPSPAFDALTFPDLLLARDSTGVPITSARIIPPSERSVPATRRISESDAGPTFQVEVDGNGLVGFAPLIPPI